MRERKKASLSDRINVLSYYRFGPFYEVMNVYIFYLLHSQITRLTNAIPNRKQREILRPQKSQEKAVVDNAVRWNRTRRHNTYSKWNRSIYLSLLTLSPNTIYPICQNGCIFCSNHFLQLQFFVPRCSRKNLPCLQSHVYPMLAPATQSERNILLRAMNTFRAKRLEMMSSSPRALQLPAANLRRPTPVKIAPAIIIQTRKKQLKLRGCAVKR